MMITKSFIIFFPLTAGKSLGGAEVLQSRKTNKKKTGPYVRDWSRPGGAPPPPPPRCRLPLPPGRPGRSGSVEHDGLGILVCHLSHVTKDIFFCDNTKKPPAGGDKGEEERRREERKRGLEK